MKLNDAVLEKITTPRADKMRTGVGILTENRRAKVHAALIARKLKADALKSVRS
jgi:hypothetical protein